MSKELTPLEALKEIENSLKNSDNLNLFNVCNLKVIRTALKALEVIKEKFEIGLLNETCNNDLKVYQLCSSTARIYIRQEEYELLKEVLL